MAIDNQKRSTMKLLAVASGALAAPGLVAAACNHSVKTAKVTNEALRGTGLVISFTDAPAMGSEREITITNMSSSSVTLSHVYPGIVSTPQGSYDINSLLLEGSRVFEPNQSTTLTIQPVNTAATERRLGVKRTDAWVSVQTRDSNINNGEHVTTVRHLYS